MGCVGSNIKNLLETHLRNFNDELILKQVAQWNAFGVTSQTSWTSFKGSEIKNRIQKAWRSGTLREQHQKSPEKHHRELNDELVLKGVAQWNA